MTTSRLRSFSLLRGGDSQSLLGAAWWLAAALTVFACGSDESGAVTQVLVEVNADSAVAARVVRIEASVYDAAGDAASSSHTQRFALGSSVSPHDAVTASFPFSFAVTKNSATAVRLELRGYDSWSADEKPIIARETILRFVQGSSLSTSIYLTAPCLDQAAMCTAAGLTCSSDGPVRCVPVTDATLVPTVSGDKPLEVPSDAGQTSMDASIMDATLGPALTGEVSRADATLANGATLPVPVLDATVADAQVVELSPEPLPACPVADACPLAAYPCIPSDDGLGYSCRGQYAAWHMPDAQPDAKYGPSYTLDTAAGTVLDNVTALLWQRDLPASYAGCTGRTAGQPGDTCTVEEAEHYCGQLTLAGKRWRLPTKIELESLIYSPPSPTDAQIDLSIFPRTPRTDFWSASPLVVPLAMNHNYFTGFATGFAGETARSDAKRVRCVRSTKNFNAPPAARYTVDVQADTVRDNFTQLTWSRGQTTSPVTAAEAETSCRDRGTGFRIPTHKELLTLAALTERDNAIDPAFLLQPTSWLSWSTTPYFSGGKMTYATFAGLSLNTGAATTDSDAGAAFWSLHVRCVR